MAIDFEKQDAVVERCLGEMMEFFDSVQIIAVVQDRAAKNSHRLAKGSGCLYARHGATREWLEYQMELVREAAREDKGEG